MAEYSQVRYLNATSPSKGSPRGTILHLAALKSQGRDPLGGLEDPVEDTEHAEGLDGRANVVRAGARDPQGPM
eukprot:5228459-Pyramimonas_sp.AAC.1